MVMKKFVHLTNAEFVFDLKTKEPHHPVQLALRAEISSGEISRKIFISIAESPIRADKRDSALTASSEPWSRYRAELASSKSYPINSDACEKRRC